MFPLQRFIKTTLILFLIHENCRAQFVQLDGVTDDTYSVHYTNSGLVWIGGDGYTWKSTDHGENFVTLESEAITGYGNSVWGTTDGIYGFSATHAFKVGYFFLPNDAIIFETNTGDGNWEMAYIENLNFFPERWTSDIDHGTGSNMIVVGSQGRIIVSSDNGANWTLVSSGTSEHFLHVEHITGNTWLANGHNFIRRSTNNGDSWSDTNFPGAYCPLLTEAGGVIYTGGENLLYKSTDNGDTWSALPETPFSAISIQALSATKLLAGAWEDLYVSYDSGESWESFQIENYSAVEHMSFYDANNGIAVGSNGYAIKTSNGGGPSFPIADFTIDSSVGCVDSLFHFTNETNGNYTYQWLVNDVLVSNDQNFDYAFPTEGIQQVKLIATNQNGSGVKTLQVTTYPIPVFDIPEITLSNDSICPNSDFTITISNPVANVTYKAINNGVLVSTVYQSANGNPIEIELQANSSGAGSTMHHFGIQAYRSNPCITHYEYVYDSILVVRPSPDIEVHIPYDTICSGFPNSDLIFQVFNSEEDFSYRWLQGGVSYTPYTPGNGDTMTYNHGHIASGVRTYGLHVKHNLLNCTYSSYSLDTIVAINNFLEQPISASQVLVGESVSFAHDMIHTHYTWDFTRLSDAPLSHLPVPPPFTYNVAGRDTITFYAQVDENNACNSTLLQVIDVIDTDGFGSYAQCATGSYEMGEVVDYTLTEDNIGYSISTKYDNGVMKLLVRKYDAANNIMLNMLEPVSGLSNIVNGSGIVSDEEGNMYITFVTTNTSAILWNTEISHKYVLAKINSQGELLWYIGSNNAAWDKPVLVNDNLIVAGFCDTGITVAQSDGSTYSSTTNSNLPTGGKGFIITFDTDGMVVRHSHFGNKLTVSTSTAFSNVNFYSSPPPPILCTAPDGNVLISGLMEARKVNQYIFMDSTIVQGEMYNAYQSAYPQVYTMRYNPTAGVVSAFSPVHGLLDELYDVTCLENGSIVYSGAVQQYFDTRNGYVDLLNFNTNFNNVGDNLFYLQCTDGTGNSLWEVFNQLTAYSTLDAFGNNEVAALGGYNDRGTWLGTGNLMLGANAEGASDCVCTTFNVVGEMTNSVNIVSPGSDLPAAMQMDACGSARIFHATNIGSYVFPFGGDWNGDITTEFAVYDLGNCSPECLESSGIAYTDVSIDAIVPDTTDPFASNTREIFVDLTNYSNVSIESLSIVCEMDGQIVDTLALNTSISPDTSVTGIALMEYTFGNSAGHRIRLWLSAVNGFADSNLSNDTLTYGFVICNGPMSGTYSIGAQSGDFTTISLAAFAVDTCGVSGPVEFLIADGVYQEVLNFRPGNGMSMDNSVTFVAENNTADGVIVIPPVGTANTTALVSMQSGSSHYKLEHITFKRNVAATAGTVVNVSANCADIAIDHCVFIGAEVVNSEILLNLNHVSNGTQIRNNQFIGGSVGLRNGHPQNIAPGYSENLVVANNTFTDQSRRNYEIYRADSLMVNGNTCQGKMPKDVSIVVAQCMQNFKFINNKIQLVNYFWSSSIISGSTSALIDSDLNNTIHFISNSPITGERALVANNVVTKGVTSNQAIWYFGGCEHTDIVHNTMSCLLEVTAGADITVRNNIFASTHLNNFLKFQAGSVSTCNNNQFDRQFDNNEFSNTFIHCNPTCGLGIVLEAWQAATSFDISSVFDTAAFFSDTDLHVSEQLNLGDASAAALIPFDMDGQPRNLVSPAIGSDEPVDIPLLVYIDEFLHPTCAAPGSGVIRVSPIGGIAPFAYLWDDGNTSSDRENLPPGTYSVTITDSNSQQVSQSFELSEPGFINVSLSFSQNCGGTSGQLTSAITGNYSTPVSYQWSTNGGGTNQTINTSGSYSLTVTDPNGCTSTSDTLEVNLGVFAVTSDTIMQSSCSGTGGIFLDTEFAIGNVLYFWNYGAYTTEDLENASPGNYDLLAVNGNGCVSLTSFELFEQMELSIIDETPCFDGTNGILHAEITGGQQPVVFNWSNGETMPTITNLGSGDYVVSAADASGCSLNLGYTIDDTPTCGCAGDMDSDGAIGIADLTLLMTEFGCLNNCGNDLNGDGIVGSTDIIIFMQLFGTTCD